MLCLAESYHLGGEPCAPPSTYPTEERMGGEGVAISDKRRGGTEEESKKKSFFFLSKKTPTQDIMPGTLSSRSRSNTQSE